MYRHEQVPQIMPMDSWCKIFKSSMKFKISTCYILQRTFDGPFYVILSEILTLFSYLFASIISEYFITAICIDMCNFSLSINDACDSVMSFFLCMQFHFRKRMQTIFIEKGQVWGIMLDGCFFFLHSFNGICKWTAKMIQVD